MTTHIELHLRDAREEDRESIQQVLLDAYGQYETILSAEQWGAYRANIIESVERQGPVARIVAEWQGTIAGSVQLFVSSESAYGLPELNIQTPIIRLLAVSPAFRGKGIATALIEESVRRALALGADFLHLHTSDMMDSAVRLYERLGFERAYDKDIAKDGRLVKSYRFPLHERSILRQT